MIYRQYVTNSLGKIEQKNPTKTEYLKGGYALKHRNSVYYLDCYLDSNLNGESMARKVFQKN